LSCLKFRQGRQLGGARQGNWQADKAVFLINDLGDKTAVYFSKTPEDSLLTDADNIKHSDLTGADNGNKPTLPDGQDDQIGFCS
jgi:hypothetical protein